MNKIFEYFTKLLFLWVIILATVGFFYPQFFMPLKNYTDWLFAITMLGIGVLLNTSDFQPIIKKPYLTLLGTLAQFTIMPVSAYFVAKLLNLPKEMAIGLIVTGCVPGAMASNVISYLAKADVAFSIALTSTSTFLSPIVTPTLIYLFAHTYIKINFWAMFFSIIKMVIIPLFIGFTLRHYFKNKIQKFEKVFPAISSLFIAFICGLVVALNQQYILQFTLSIFLAVFLVNFLGLSLGYLAGVLYGWDEKKRRTVAIEVGMQNAGLGAVLSLKHFSAQAALPNALFATWCIITASILAEIWARRK